MYMLEVQTFPKYYIGPSLSPKVKKSARKYQTIHFCQMSRDDEIQDIFWSDDFSICDTSIEYWNHSSSKSESSVNSPSSSTTSAQAACLLLALRDSLTGSKIASSRFSAPSLTQFLTICLSIFIPRDMYTLSLGRFFAFTLPSQSNTISNQFFLNQKCCDSLSFRDMSGRDIGRKWQKKHKILFVSLL